VHPHGAQLKSYLRGTFPAVRDVDDVVQESYLRIWKARAAAPIHSAKSFLFQVARRVALDVLRKGRNSPIEEGRDFAASRVMDNGPDSVQALITREMVDQLTDAIVALPPRCREVVLLRRLEGLSQRETAEKLGLSEKTVEKYAHNGLLKCSEFLRGRGIEGFFR
jgi:RNA polymerase sigma-70 factor (ECF subfamily)